MSLIEKTLFGTEDKVQSAIDMLKEIEPPEGYYLAFSGGKDSIVIKRLAQIAGVKFDIHYSVTTIDPPELIYYIREHHPEVVGDRADEPFLSKLAYKGFPIRQSRWCCAEYKEKGGEGRFVITGVRAAESSRRAKRKQVEFCMRGGGKRYLHIIFRWTDSDVWEFIRREQLPYCKLYDEGWDRIGCLFCPMAKQSIRSTSVERYPMFARAFSRAFAKLYQLRKEQGRTSVDRWDNGEEMFNWWISEQKQSKENPDQMVMFE